MSDQAVTDLPVSTSTVVDDLIPFYAAYWGVSAPTLDTVIKCESNFVSDAVGDEGHAHGLVQINNLYHPDISISEADSPVWSVNYLSSQIADGNGSQWTCYRKFYD